MVGEDQLVRLAGEPDQHPPQQRRLGHVEGTGPLPPDDLLHVAAAGEVDLLPGQLDRPGDHLDGPAQVLVPERRPQVGVPAQQRPRGRLERGHVKRAFQVDGELRGVDVGCSALL